MLRAALATQKKVCFLLVTRLLYCLLRLAPTKDKSFVQILSENKFSLIPSLALVV